MTGLVGYFLLFVVVGAGFILVHLLAGKLIRPAKPDPEKLTIYECGEPTIGSSWVQFDLRFYVVALLFVIFDVEVVFFFPWAVVFGKATNLARMSGSSQAQVAPLTGETKELADQLIAPTLQTATTQPGPFITHESALRLAWLAFWDIMVFFGVLLVGFAYLWKRGDLDWVRSTLAERGGTAGMEELPGPAPVEREALAAAGSSS
jgi:NADH-quinone oxidoreductase subunit A